MNSAALLEYVSRLKAASDEDAFHCLIEAGDEAVAPVSAAITPECSTNQLKRFVEVLQEIRTNSALNQLRKLCLVDFSEKWIVAAEGLFYNNPNAACRILSEVLQDSAQSDREAKSKVVAELVASLESPNSPNSP